MIFAVDSANSGLIERRRFTVFSSSSTVYFTSSIVFSLPNVKRILPCASSAGTPIASTVLDASRLPELHALPLDAQMPARSRVNKMLSPSIYLNVKCALPARRFSPPLYLISGILSLTSFTNSSRSAAMYALFSSILLTAFSIAKPMPTTPGVFVVPAR